MLSAEKLKELKATRTRKLYIEAVADLMQKEGIDGISMRKISKIVGYNSATAYNYFENQEHLVTFASLKFLDPYTQALNEILQDDDINALERYVRVFSTFAQYSFASPTVYRHLFYGNYSEKLSRIIKEYYEIYPEELTVRNTDVREMLFAGSISERERHITMPIYKEGFITAEAQEHLAEFAIALHERLLYQLCTKEPERSPKEQTKLYIDSMKFLLRSIKIPNTPTCEMLD